MIARRVTDGVHRIRRHPNPWIRRSIAIALMAGGVLGFLPILGFWMFPLGLLILSDDVPWVRRHRRRLAVWWGRWLARRGWGGNRSDGVPSGGDR
jgi:hypothetical protein